MKPGIHTIPASEYHAGPAGSPSLSRSIAHLLCTSSPAHAWTAHPRLNPDLVREESGIFDLGTAAHELFLGGPERVQIIEAADWRTNAAKEARDDARANGLLPLLEKNWSAVSDMVAAMQSQLDALDVDPAPFTDGKAEQTLVWDEDGVACRALVDWLRDDRLAIDDLKTTSRTANPEAFSRSLFSSGYDIQAAMYVRGLQALTGAEAEFRFVVVENYPPFALSVVALGPAAMSLARKKVDYALGVWRHCLGTGEWSAYPTRTCFADLPPFVESAWLAKEERELVA